jgi:hypothetical protein
MTKQLFEEALADVKKVKQVAEEQALRAMTEAVVPRIREFIEQAILDEHGLQDGEPDGDEAPAEPGAPGLEGELLTDTPPVGSVSAAGVVAPVADDSMSASGITPPDAEGKITIDLDALCGGSSPAPGMPSTAPGPAVPPPMFGEPAPRPEEAEYEISMESLDALQPVLSSVKKAAKPATKQDFASVLGEVVKQVKLCLKASAAVRGTPSYEKHIAQMISRVEDMYEYVQESVTDPAKKSSYETVLENSFKVLNKLQESTTMSQKTQKGRVNEADLTLKLTGLPDEVEDNLDAVGVDLITGEEDEEGLEMGAEGGDQGGDDAGMGGLDLGGEQGQDEDTQMENRRLSDDTIVEIDEKMLRREIARMRSLREETNKPADWGHGPGGANILDDFGGGKDEGDPTVGQEISDLSPAKAARPLGEADEDLDEAQDEMDESDQMDEADDQDMDEGDYMDESDQMDEQDDMDQSVAAAKDMAMQESALDQIGDERTRDDFGGSATSVPSKDKSNPADRHAEASRRLGFEQKLQERAKARAASLKKEAAKARAAKNGKRLAEVKKEYAVVAQRFNESLARSKKFAQIKADAAKKLQEARSNSAAARPADGKADEILRKKLAETNLLNAKLLFTNKLLQTEGLTARQKAQVIKQLDEAKTAREAKLIFESLTRTLAAPGKSLKEGSEGRQVLGSASRATRPASTQSLNEGADVERWAQLAGISKR